MQQRISLEQAAEKICIEASKPPLIFQLAPEKAREVLNTAQDAPVFKYPATITTKTVDTDQWGIVTVHFVWPDHVVDTPNVIFYIHGGGWVLGNLHTHDKLVRELAARTNSVIIFPEYSLSPEARYPTAIEQCYAILSSLPYIADQMSWNMNLDSLTVAGDSVGGNMATIMTIMAKYRNGPKIHKQLMYYPVANASFDTGSYIQFAENYYLYREGMMWFWDQYTTSEDDRNQMTTSPLRATSEQLRGLPDAMILNGQADVLCDEGEAYAVKLRESGVDVTTIRLNGMIHDFVMLNALDQTNATRAAMDLSTEWINRKNRLSV